MTDKQTRNVFEPMESNDTVTQEPEVSQDSYLRPTTELSLHKYRRKVTSIEAMYFDGSDVQMHTISDWLFRRIPNRFDVDDSGLRLFPSSKVLDDPTGAMFIQLKSVVIRVEPNQYVSLDDKGAIWTVSYFAFHRDFEMERDEFPRRTFNERIQ